MLGFLQGSWQCPSLLRGVALEKGAGEWPVMLKQQSPVCCEGLNVVTCLCAASLCLTHQICSLGTEQGCLAPLSSFLSGELLRVAPLLPPEAFSLLSTW